MEFRLTYSGLLFSTGNDSKLGKKADHKHDLRVAFHAQMKRLWEVTPFLRTGERSGPDVLLLSGDMQKCEPPNYKASWLAKKHAQFGWKFVPLVSSELDLWCSLEILFLRPSKPGGVVTNQGDLDGRLKTLLDALSIPDANQQYEDRLTNGKPLFVLLENDRLVSKVSVESDQLLEQSVPPDENFVRLVITVSIRPYEMHLGNMQFG
jgi:hypothetical protein